MPNIIQFVGRLAPIYRGLKRFHLSLPAKNRQWRWTACPDLQGIETTRSSNSLKLPAGVGRLAPIYRGLKRRSRSGCT